MNKPDIHEIARELYDALSLFANSHVCMCDYEPDKETGSYPSGPNHDSEGNAIYGDTCDYCIARKTIDKVKRKFTAEEE